MAYYDSTASSSTVWRSWVSTDTTASTSTSGTGDTWYCWTSNLACSGTTATTISNDSVWHTWTSIDTAPMTVLGEPCVETEEELQGRRRREEESRKREEELRKKKSMAEATARELLLDLIGEDQCKVYDETGRLFVKGREYDYVIKKNGGVQRIEKDKIIDLCVHLKKRWQFPDTDNVIALKLMLENDEDAVNRIANRVAEREKPDRLSLAACL